MTSLKDILNNINWQTVSREHPLGKLEGECLDIRPLLDHLSIDYNNVEKTERPDFIVNGTIGIELVACYPHNYEKGVKSVHTDAYLNRVSVEYKKYLDSIGLRYWVTINYKDDIVYNNKIRESIPNFAKEVIAELEEVRKGVERSDFKYIWGASFSPLSINEITQMRAMWVPEINYKALQDTISGKDNLLPSFKSENTMISQWWLFIKCTDIVETKNISEFEIISSYDKVFLFISHDNKLIDLK